MEMRGQCEMIYADSLVKYSESSGGQSADSESRPIWNLRSTSGPRLSTFSQEEKTQALQITQPVSVSHPLRKIRLFSREIMTYIFVK